MTCSSAFIRRKGMSRRKTKRSPRNQSRSRYVRDLPRNSMDDDHWSTRCPSGDLFDFAGKPNFHFFRHNRAWGYQLGRASDDHCVLASDRTDSNSTLEAPLLMSDEFQCRYANKHVFYPPSPTDTTSNANRHYLSAHASYRDLRETNLVTSSAHNT